MLTFLTLFCCSWCSPMTNDSIPSLNQLNYTVERALDWDSLFIRNSGWFGGDGIFTIPFNGVDTPHEGDSTLIVFSDTMAGDIRDGQLQPGFSMIHNSVAVLKGKEPLKENIHFYWNTDNHHAPATLFEPRTPAAGKADYYWLGDGFVNTAPHHNIYIFAYRIRNVSDKDFGFEEVGNALLVLPAHSRPPYTAQRQLDTPFFLAADSTTGSGSFGAGIFVNTKAAGAPHPDGYVYVYGVKGTQKAVMVARVLPADFENFGRWRFWDGQQWVPNIRHAATIANRASNELSVTPLKDGRYALIFQVDGIGTAVGLRLGASPAGPFGPVIKIWECPEVKENKHFFVYNAKAHPHLSRPGELLISYNVNSFDFLHELPASPHLYRPRFIRLILH
ncbi:uncharacterized protein DUF4185 [Chitinophaga polysaccharea]|uniref:Uncharacterized protein DUF4185 n=1 Tax=Chitinophaga polysaccharea TaxID=1293035 RepID=A0A561PR04_9BACT|nr:DUF4185 domain-containing protein [Chitinophaga polysaccharea]TWF40535.1 uncharacterized protein DUF4185 [Chitinophaga polysaccharea]